MVRALVVEDEVLVAQRLIRFIKEVSENAISIHHERTLSEAKNYLTENEIHLLFLDLNLNGKSGFDLLKSIMNARFHTIIVSAYTDKALEAFEYGVLDFIPKPFTLERLSKAMLRFSSIDTSGSGMMTKLAVTTGGNTLFIPLSDILYVQADKIYSQLHCRNGDIHLYSKPLNGLMQLLPVNYYRIHRSFAVDLNNIDRIQKVKHNTFAVELKSGEQLPISRNIKSELANRLSE